jgi:hypothetical protein
MNNNNNDLDFNTRSTGSNYDSNNQTLSSQAPTTTTNVLASTKPSGKDKA